jgi:hypothetical protein
MSEYVKIHVERYRLGEGNVSDNMACAEREFSPNELQSMPHLALLNLLWELIDQTAGPTP